MVADDRGYQHKSHAIKPDEAGRCSQPQVAIRTLQDLIDGFTWQPVLRSPQIMAVLIGGLVGIEAERRSRRNTPAQLEARSSAAGLGCENVAGSAENASRLQPGDGATGRTRRRSSTFAGGSSANSGRTSTLCRSVVHGFFFRPRFLEVTSDFTASPQKAIERPG